MTAETPERAGATAGDEVGPEIEPDLAPREVEMPVNLATVLAGAAWRRSTTATSDGS